MQQTDLYALPARIFDKIAFEPNTGCWLWTGQILPNGYGAVSRTKAQGKGLAHRYVYERLVSQIPPRQQLDHLCRVRRCVNPDHLRVVTCQQNLLAAGSLAHAAFNARKTHCLRGHEFTESNTYSYRGRRRCRACMRRRAAA